MAHYLSDVTHLRLELRWSEEDGAQRGIAHTHDFTGQIRCVEVIPREAPHVEIWTGDTDGTLTVRRGLDGRPVRAVPPLGYNIFIYCLQFAKPNVWCGRSDGFIQVYDVDSFVRICEFKAHAGAVNCLDHIETYVVSGGSDWQIVVWNAATALRVHQFTGHSNGVRCLTKEGFLLYSGADDGVIHCWNMEMLSEKSPLWPIKAHEESVRALVRHEVYLFSCSNDGSIRAWNTQTAQLAKVVDHRSAAVNNLMLIPTSGKLWSCSSDGLVTVFDVATLEQDSTITGHRATNVPVVRQVASASSTKLWTVSSDGLVRVWYNDTEPGAQNTEFTAIAEMEQQLQVHVDACRKRIVHNYHQLERCKEDLLELERRDLTKKSKMGVVFANMVNRSKLLRSVHAVGLAGQQTRRRDLALQAATEQHRVNTNLFLRPFYLTWQKLQEARRTHRSKIALKECVAKVSQDALTSRLLQNVAAQARHQFANDQLRVLASHSATRTQLALLRGYFATWIRGAQCSRLAAQQEALRACPLTAAAFIRSSTLWNTLKCAQVEVETHQILSRAAERQSLDANKRLLRDRFVTWIQYHQHVLYQKQRARTATVAAASNQRLLLARYFLKWASSRQMHAVAHSVATVNAQEAHLHHLESTIAKGTGVTEEDLEYQLQQKQMELARILEECRDLDREVESRQQEKRVLQRELLRDYSVDQTLPIVDQLDKSIFFLKARGVNTYHDIETLATAREDLRKVRADAMIGDGIAHVRKSIARYAKPEKLKTKGEPDWYVGELFQKIKRKGVEKAAVGICRIVLAFDSVDKLQVSSWISKDSNKEWDKKHQYAAEVTSNLGPLLELSLRAYRYHRGEDPITGLPKSAIKKKVRKSYTSAGPPAGGKSGKSGKPGTAGGVTKKKAISRNATAVVPKQALKRRTVRRGKKKSRKTVATVTIDEAALTEVHAEPTGSGNMTTMNEETKTALALRSAASVEPQDDERFETSRDDATSNSLNNEPQTPPQHRNDNGSTNNNNNDASYNETRNGNNDSITSARRSSIASAAGSPQRNGGGDEGSEGNNASAIGREAAQPEVDEIPLVTEEEGEEEGDDAALRGEEGVASTTPGRNASQGGDSDASPNASKNNAYLLQEF